MVRLRQTVAVQRLKEKIILEPPSKHFKLSDLKENDEPNLPILLDTNNNKQKNATNFHAKSTPIILPVQATARSTRLQILTWAFWPRGEDMKSLPRSLEDPPPCGRLNSVSRRRQLRLLFLQDDFK